MTIITIITLMTLSSHFFVPAHVEFIKNQEEILHISGKIEKSNQEIVNLIKTKL